MTEKTYEDGVRAGRKEVVDHLKECSQHLILWHDGHEFLVSIGLKGMIVMGRRHSQQDWPGRTMVSWEEIESSATNPYLTAIYRLLDCFNESRPHPGVPQ